MRRKKKLSKNLDGTLTVPKASNFQPSAKVCTNFFLQKLYRFFFFLFKKIENRPQLFCIHFLFAIFFCSWKNCLLFAGLHESQQRTRRTKVNLFKIYLFFNFNSQKQKDKKKSAMFLVEGESNSQKMFEAGKFPNFLVAFSLSFLLIISF